MTPNLRKFALAVHVAVSVGWIGAAAVYLVIAAAAMSSSEPQSWRLGWTVLELTGWYVLVPMAALALITGLVMALGTTWGLARHYWVLLSFFLTTIAAAILVKHMFDVSAIARVASAVDADVTGLRLAFRGELLHAGMGLLLLIGIEALNVYKPRGLTPFGLGPAGREEPTIVASARPAQVHLGRQPLWMRVVLGHVAALGLLTAIFHIARAGIQH